MKHFFTALGLSLALASCAPKVITQATGRATPTSATEGFPVIKETETFTGPAEELGDIQVKDSGFSLICDYETAVARCCKTSMTATYMPTPASSHMASGSPARQRRLSAKILRAAAFCIPRTCARRVIC